MTWWQGGRSRWLMAAGGTLLGLACGSTEDTSGDDEDGGSSNGGSSNAGSSNGGSATGGSARAGSSNGGSMNGGAGNGGSAIDGGEAGEGARGGSSGSGTSGAAGAGMSGVSGAAGVGMSGMSGAAGAGMSGTGGASMAGAGGKGGAAGAGGRGGSGGASGAGGAGGTNVGGSGGLGADNRPNGSTCMHGGQCQSGHCQSGLCVDPPGWGGATALSSAPSAPSIAMPAFGSAAIVWRDDPTDRVLSRVASGKVFGSETRIDSQSGAVSVSDPDVAFTGGQSFLATWSESFSSDDYRVFARPYTGTWGASNDIDGADAPMQLPRIATDPNGNGAVVYNGRDDFFVWMRQLSGPTLGAPSNFNLGSDQDVAVSRSGRIAVAWCVGVTATADLWVASYAPGQGWGAPMRAYAGVPGGACHDPVIAIADDGDMAVTWMDGPSVGRPYARAYSASTGWESSTLIEPDIIYGSLSPIPVFSATGALLLVWYRVDSTLPGGCHVNYRLRLGGAWTPNQTLDECEYPAGFLTAETYDRESFRVIYHRTDPNLGGIELWDARYVGGQGFRDRRRITPTADIQLAPALALDASGRGLLAWIHRQGSQTTDPRELRAMWLE